MINNSSLKESELSVDMIQDWLDFLKFVTFIVWFITIQIIFYEKMLTHILINWWT